MARGRPPKPTRLKILQGNPGKRPLNDAEPTPAVAMPDRPDWLGTEAAAEWDRIAPELLELGLLSRIDGTALAAYCVACGNLVDASRQLRDEGLTVQWPLIHRGVIVTHVVKPHPAAAIAKEAAQQVKSFLSEFGLSPAARARIKVPPKEERDELTDFLGGGS